MNETQIYEQLRNVSFRLDLMEINYMGTTRNRSLPHWPEKPVPTKPNLTSTE